MPGKYIKRKHSKKKLDKKIIRTPGKAGKVQKVHPKTDKKKLYWLLGLIVIITFLVYSPVLKNEFVNFDDERLIINNHLVTGGSDTPVSAFFKRYLNSAHYKPLVLWSWNIEYRLFGDNPSPYHLHNLILHIINSILVFLIVGKISGRYLSGTREQHVVALFSALVFALHPLHVESVAWATERKDVLYSFFFLIGILGYIYYIENQKSYRWLILSIICFMLSILSKSMSITMIAVVLLIDFTYRRKISTRMILEKIPFLVIFLVGVLLYSSSTNFASQIKGIGGGMLTEGLLDYPDNFNGLPSFYTRVLIVNIRLILWLIHIIIPVKLASIYPRLSILEDLGGYIHLFPLITLSLLFFLIRFRRRAGYLLFGFLFFIITISPALAISEKGTGVFLSDRYVYMALAGIWFGLIIGFRKLLSQKQFNRTFIAVMAFVCLVFAVAAHQRTKVWRNSETLWTDVIKKYPTVVVAYHNRGEYYTDIRQFNKALADYNRCLELKPTKYDTYNNRSALYGMTGKFEAALKDLNKAIELKPDYLDAYQNRALTYYYLEMFEQAIPDCDYCLGRNPGDAMMWDLRGTCKRVTGQYEASIADHTKAIELDSRQGIFWLNRSLSYDAVGDYSRALEDVLKAKELRAPVDAQYLLNLRERVNDKR